MKHSVLIDVDTGIDDAMAIMFAVRHPEIDVRGITCTSGNVAVDHVVRNTLRVLDLVDAPDIPVAAGATRPLIEPARNASAFHGQNGLADLELPESGRSVRPEHAVSFLRTEILSSQQPLTLIALAPLTTIALLLRMHPEVADRLERIVFMGGSAAIGNASAVAEFNIWHDPEAASIVLSSGVPLVMYGLDVFDRVEVVDEKVRELRDSPDPVEKAVGDLLGFQFMEQVDGTELEERLIGDAGAVCALVAPELFTFETWPVQVELAPGYSRGQTLVDRRGYVGEDTQWGVHGAVWPHVDVALDTNVEGVIDLFFGTIFGEPEEQRASA